MPIEIRHFRYFLAVAEELHFGRAAKRLHLAQPPLSRAIRQLEQEIGVTLFERTSRAVRTTSAGVAFAEQARQVLAHVNIAVAEAQSAAGNPPALRIGCSPLLSPEFLERVLAAIRARLPRLQTEVAEMYSMRQVDALRTANLDVGFLIGIEDDPCLETEPVCPAEPLRVLLPADHPACRKEVVEPDDLRDDVIVVIARAVNPRLHEHYLAQFEAGGYRFRDIRESNGLGPREAVLAVTGGLGVTLILPWVLELTRPPSNVVSRPLDPPIDLPPTAIGWRRDPPRSLSATIAVVREAAREIHSEQEQDSTSITRAQAGI